MKLLELAVAYLKADQALKTCVRESGYEAGHFCYRHREAVTEAENAFEEELNRLIDERIPDHSGAAQ